MRRAVGLAAIVGTIAGLALLAIYVGFAGALGTPVALMLTAAIGALAGGLAWLALRRAASASRGEPPVPPAVSEVEVNLIPKGPVKACLRCGSMAMQPAPLGADALFSQWRCARCGWRGQPLQFDDGEAYAAFVEGLRRDRGGSEP